MAYEVKLEVFEGPIDLLLHLITRQRVDIYEVSISTITEEYLEAVGSIEDLDLESATGFLVVAATLLELKSARLLPARSLDDADGQLLEERDMLLARLVELSTLREAGAWIAVGLEKGAVYMARTAGLEPQFVGLAPDLLDEDLAGQPGLGGCARACTPTRGPAGYLARGSYHGVREGCHQRYLHGPPARRSGGVRGSVRRYPRQDRGRRPLPRPARAVQGGRNRALARRPIR